MEIETKYFDYKQWKKNYFLEHPCVDCGIKDIRVLEFDRIEIEDEKSVNSSIDDSATTKIINQEKLLKLIDKCDVRCSNCHKIRHLELLDSNV